MQLIDKHFVRWFIFSTLFLAKVDVGETQYSHALSGAEHSTHARTALRMLDIEKKHLTPQMSQFPHTSFLTFFASNNNSKISQSVDLIKQGNNFVGHTLKCHK